MRRLVSLLVLVVLAFTLVGCGGGGDAAETEEAPAPAETAAPVPVEGATIGDRSVNVTTTFEPFPTGTFVPTDLKTAIDAKQPTLILFYDSSHTSSTNRDIIDDVREDNRGLVDLFTYDIARYVTTSPQGVVTVDPALINDPGASQAVQLARELGVTSAPFIVITDGQGYITWKFRGLVDQAFLEREVVRASR